MTRYHHRLAMIALTLALAAAIPATFAADQSSTPADASPCSEVCSGGAASYGLPSAAPAPSPCSEVCSGGAASYGTTVSATHTNPTIRPATVRVVTHGGGFDWGYAGIGAGGMLALTLIGLGGALTLTQRRKHRIRAS